MAGLGFDPLQLTSHAGLNQLVLGDVGLPEVAGRRAEAACSRDALVALAMDCGLSGLRPDRLSDDLARAVTFADASTARSARAVLTGFGRRLGALIATLRDPATSVQQADTPQRRAFFAHWLTVDSVWLAGGLLAGCGQLITAAAATGAAAAPIPCRVALAQHPAMTPLLGAARRAGAGAGHELLAVADLGHTSIKTAIAERHGPALTQLTIIGTGPAPSRRSPATVADAVVDALARAVRRAATAVDHPGCVRTMVSVASHVAAGVPVDDGGGIYGCLAGHTASLTRQVQAASGTEVTLEFVHDGTAAAAAGPANSATITVGTWLGVGFHPVPAPPLLDLAPHLRVELH